MHGRVELKTGEFEARESEEAAEMTTSDARSPRGDLDDADRRRESDETPQAPLLSPEGGIYRAPS